MAKWFIIYLKIPFHFSIFKWSLICQFYMQILPFTLLNTCLYSSLLVLLYLLIQNQVHSLTHLSGNLGVQLEKDCDNQTAYYYQLEKAACFRKFPCFLLGAQ